MYLKAAKNTCDTIHKKLVKKILEGGSFNIDVKDVPDTFRSMGYVIIITIKGTHYHKADVRYSQ